MKNNQKYIAFFLLIMLAFSGTAGSRVKKLHFNLTPVNLPESIWNIQFLIEHENRLYIFDRYQNSLSKCGLDGELTGSLIFEKGQGPGEIMQPAGLAASGGKLFLLDWQLRRVTCFDTTLQFMYSFNIPYQQPRMLINRDNIYLLSGEQKSQRLVHKFDLEGNKIADFVPYFDIPELDHLKENQTRGIGALFTPTGWAFQDELIWLKNPFRYQIAGFTEDKQVNVFYGDDSMVKPPKLHFSQSESFFSHSIQHYGMSSLYLHQDKLIVYLQYMEDENKRIYKNTLHLLTLPEGALIAEKTWLENPNDERPPAPIHINNEKIYFSSEEKLYSAEMVIE